LLASELEAELSEALVKLSADSEALSLGEPKKPKEFLVKVFFPKK
jgi:hypothetical protein